MKTTEAIQARADEFGDIKFVKHIEQRLKEGWKPDKLQEAMRGTFANFAPELREDLDDYLHRYLERWLNPMISRHDMYIVFLSTAEDLRENAPRSGDSISDEQIIDMFNILSMKLTRLAYTDRKLRRVWGIKKGWLS